MTPEALRQLTDNKRFWGWITTPDTHICRHQYNDEETLNRILTGKTIASQFLPEHTEEDLQFIVIDTIYANANEITDGMEYNPNRSRQCFTLQYDPTDPIGSSIVRFPSGRIQEMSSKNISLVLQRDMTSKTGFSLVTAFPDITRDASFTGKDLTQPLKQTQAFQTASPLQQAVWLQQISAAPLHGIRLTDDISIRFHVPDPKHPGYTHYIYTDGFETTLITRNPDKQPVETEYTRQYKQECKTTGHWLPSTPKVYLTPDSAVAQTFLQTYPALQWNLEQIERHLQSCRKDTPSIPQPETKSRENTYPDY